MEGVEGVETFWVLVDFWVFHWSKVSGETFGILDNVLGFSDIVRVVSARQGEAFRPETLSLAFDAQSKTLQSPRNGKSQKKQGKCLVFPQIFGLL